MSPQNSHPVGMTSSVWDVAFPRQPRSGKDSPVCASSRLVALVCAREAPFQLGLCPVVLDGHGMGGQGQQCWDATLAFSPGSSSSRAHAYPRAFALAISAAGTLLPQISHSFSSSHLPACCFIKGCSLSSLQQRPLPCSTLLSTISICTPVHCLLLLPPRLEPGVCVRGGAAGCGQACGRAQRMKSRPASVWWDLEDGARGATPGG